METTRNIDFEALLREESLRRGDGFGGRFESYADSGMVLRHTSVEIVNFKMPSSDGPLKFAVGEGDGTGGRV